MDENPVRNLSNSVFNGNIMLTSVLILLLAIIIVVLFHIYARNRHHHLRNQSERRRDIYLASSDTAISQRLDPSILKELSKFRFSYKSKLINGQPLECAVCLSEFEDDEIGRVLPNCNHCFHLQCIDVWFQFHSNCPLCRAPVQPIMNLDQVVGLESGLSSVLNPVSQRIEEDQIVSSTSVCSDKKLPELTSITWEAPGMSQKLTSDAVFH